MPHKTKKFAQSLLRGAFYRFSLLTIAIIMACPAYSAAAADETDYATVFLPLKVIAVSDDPSLSAGIDEAYRESLQIREQRMISREEIGRHLDYQKEWPPSVTDLRALPETSGKEYVAIGTVLQSAKKISIDMVVYNLRTAGRPFYFYKEGLSLADLPQLTNSVVGDILAYTGREFTIARVTVANNSRIDTGAIQHRIATTAGTPYNQESLRRDLKSIFEMGYFEDVHLLVEETGKGKVITFKVFEKPLVIGLNITGADKIKEEEIRAVISLNINDIVNPQKVKESIEKIKHLYKEKGFYNTRVESEFAYPDENKVRISFAITEGPKMYIKEIKMVGNKSFPPKDLEAVLSTSEKDIFSWITDSGLLKKEELNEDAARLSAFYHNKGFMDAKVDKPQVDQQDEWLYVVFYISEGERYRMGKVTIDGDLIEDSGKLLDMVKLDEEEFFSRQTLREDILKLTDFYSEKGYAYAEALPQVDQDRENRIVNISINISKKEMVYINRIIIRGNTLSRDKVIRREMLIKEIEPFNAVALRESHQKLQRLNYFEEINISPEVTADPTKMDIIVDVKEKPTGTFSIGAGYSSVDDLLFMAELSKDNFMGKGQKISLMANFSGSSKRYNISFTEPHLADTELLTGFDVYNWERQYDSYTKDSQGFALRFGYPLWEKWQVFFGYSYDDTKLTDVNLLTASISILDSMDINLTSAVRLSFNRDTRNAAYNASRGSVNNISLKYAGGPLGGDSSFTKVEMTSSWYYQLPLDTVFHVKGSTGYVRENSYGELPVYERFYLGGINTIRGFKSGHISPRDPYYPVDGDRIGGDKMWYTNIELIFPLVNDAGLKGLVFFDAGMVYPEWEYVELSYDRVKKSAGFGFRWLSPMGPLRLEWGYVIDPVEDEDRSNWDFSIGGSF